MTLRRFDDTTPSCSDSAPRRSSWRPPGLALALLSFLFVQGAEAQAPYDPPRAVHWLLLEDFGLDSFDGANFGQVLEKGDFDGNGILDLVIGAPGLGGVFVQYDAANLAEDSDSRRDLRLDPIGPPSGCGYSLAAGDLDGDGFDDLAVGCPSADRVRVFRGGFSGLDFARSFTLVPDCGEAGEPVMNPGLFGMAVKMVATTSEGSREFRDKLVVGAPQGQTLTMTAAGGYVLEVALEATETFRCLGVWHQDSPEIEMNAELGDFFGFSLGTGDFDGDGLADLVVGAPYETLESKGAWRAGAITVVWGQSGMRPFSAGAVDVLNSVHQSDGDSPFEAEPEDLFGYAVEGLRWYEYDENPTPHCDWIMVGSPGDEFEAHLGDVYSGTILTIGRRDLTPCSRHVLTSGRRTLLVEEGSLSGVDRHIGVAIETWRYGNRDYTMYGISSSRHASTPFPGTATIAREKSDVSSTDGFLSYLDRLHPPGCEFPADCPITNFDEYGRGLAILGQEAVAVGAPNAFSGRTGRRAGAVFVFVD